MPKAGRGTPSKTPTKKKPGGTPSKPSPNKEDGTPSRSPTKLHTRATKFSYKGDELGKNKKQSSIMQFFSPKDKESPIQLVVSKPKAVKTEASSSRKALFPNPVVTAEPIVISDEDSPRSPQPSVDQFHPKTKTAKEHRSILSRKSLKRKSPYSSAALSTNPEVPLGVPVSSTAPAEDEITISSSPSSQEDVRSPSLNEAEAERSLKKFRKQVVGNSWMTNETENVLKQITPSNKPSLLSTKSRKRKNTESSSSPSLISPTKKVKSESSDDSPVPRDSVRDDRRDSSPKIDRVTFENDRGYSTPPTVKPADDSDENDSSHIFLKSPLRPSPVKDDPPRPPGLRVKPILDLLSPRYLTDEQKSAHEVPSAIATGSSGSCGSKTYKMPIPLSPLPQPETENAGISHSASSCYDEGKSKTVESGRLPTLNPKSNPSSSSRCPPQKPPSPCNVNTVSHATTSVETGLGLDKVDWSEPMEQEIIHASPLKRPRSVESTPKKLNPDDGAKKPTPIKLGPSTPSKVPTTPTKNSTPSTSSQSTPRKSFWSPKKVSPKKFGSPFKKELTSGNLLLQHCIGECKRYAKMALRLNATNKKVADDYLGLDHTEKLLLHHLLMRKWAWIRQCDMNYSKFIPHINNSLKILKDKGFVESIGEEADLEVVVNLLKRPELVELCKSHKIDSIGLMKKNLVAGLMKFANRQAGLGFTTKTLKSAMLQTAIKILGTCVRIVDHPRKALQQIFEACMSPVFLEGKFYTFQERMRAMGDLMDSIKYQNKKLLDTQLSDSQLFLTTSQFDEYISSVILKFDMFAAREQKDVARGVELAKDARSSLLIYVSSPCVQDFLDKMPRYVWRYTAGSNYASALDAGIEFFKKAKDFDTAVLALDVLLGQERFRKRCRGNWYAEKVLIMDKHLKRPTGEIYHVIMTGLREDLTPIGRLELSKKAEILLNKKKNGLSDDQVTEMRKLMRTPRLNHPVKEIKSIEAPNMSSGTRQTFVEVSADGERTYLNVEQAARNAYMNEYPEGCHDEGSLVKNIILAAFWPVIYLPMDEMFVSSYQHAPLDWGTRQFYVNRKKEIKEHIMRLREGGIEGVMQQITDVITLYSNSHSLVDWFRIAHDTLPTVKNVLTCLTLDKFLLLADHLLEAHRERRSGWPDLTLWNTVAGTFKLVEVKSPNDELSFKQVVWLEKFLEMGISVEECRVNSSNKNKKRKAMAALANSDASQEV